MQMLNSSPEVLETVVDNPQEYINESDEDLAAAPNGAVFRQDEDGLFRLLVDKALELTQAAGDRRDKFDPNSDEWAYWNQVREARKRIRNGLYGVLGWEHFFLYSEPVAAAITAMAREVIITSKEWVDANTRGEVVYGDTDSCYISWPDEWSIQKSLEHTASAVETLNNEVYPALAEDWGMNAEASKWNMEIEDASSIMYQSGKKKRYAKNVVWKEGMPFDETMDDPYTSISGYEYQRSDCAPALADVQKKVLHGIVTGEDDSQIREYVYEATKEIERRGSDMDRIGVPGGIGKDLDQYDSDTAQVRAAKTANELLGTDIQKGDKPKRVYLEEKKLEANGKSVQPDVIGFMDESDLAPVQDQLYVDVGRMRDVVIGRPMGRILEPLGIETEAAMNGRRQEAITDFL
jgi:DNA polymerase I